MEPGRESGAVSIFLTTDIAGVGVYSLQASRAARITRIADTAASVLLPLIRALTTGLPSLGQKIPGSPQVIMRDVRGLAAPGDPTPAFFVLQ